MEKFEDVKDEVTDMIDDHPYVFAGVVYGIAMLAVIPICYACYKWQGKIIGKEVAKSLTK